MSTRLQFQVKTQLLPEDLISKYPAISKNVSLEGLGFVASKPLSEGDLLILELYLPHERNPIHMEGKVCWSKPAEVEIQSSKLRFETGVQLIKIEGQTVPETIYFDKEYKILWSKVLDSILGGYRLHVQKEKNRNS
jgi:hypothetical protein